MRREVRKTYRIPVEWRTWIKGSAALRFLVWEECKRRNVRMRDRAEVMRITHGMVAKLRSSSC